MAPSMRPWRLMRSRRRLPESIMSFRTAALAALACLAVAACAGRATRQPNAVPIRWTGSLTPQSTSTITGSANVTRGDSAAQMKVAISILGAAAGDLHPWHLHAGRCGDDGPIVGPAAAYPALNVDAKGYASALTILPLEVPRDGNYSVSVHLSPTELGTVVACTNLATSGM